LAAQILFWLLNVESSKVQDVIIHAAITAIALTWSEGGRSHGLESDHVLLWSGYELLLSAAFMLWLCNLHSKV